MSHHIYQTEAFVIDSKDVGEANKLVFLFTKDLGLIMASAQGVRHLKSKLRYSLQDFSHSKVSLVRGKEIWRLTSAALIENMLVRMSPESFAFARALSLVKRLVHGEEKNAALWSTLQSAAEFLDTSKIKQFSGEHFEYVLVLRILKSLGYIAQNPTNKQFIENDDWTEALLLQVESVKKALVMEINKALKESQL